MKRRLFLSAACLLSALTLFGQSESAFQFLQLPTSARVAGVGGDNVTLTADDPMVAFHNPALLTWCSEGQLSLSYMNYMEGTNRAGASYTLRPGDRSALAFGGQYLGFGSMSQTAVDGSDMGTFSAKDMLLTALYSYDLSDRWSGGVAAKFIYSNYDIVYSVALGVDLGVNYYDSDNGGVRKMRLMTNNPVKRVGLEAYGLEIVENLPIEVTPNCYNEHYLRTKKERMGHNLHL